VARVGKNRFDLRNARGGVRNLAVDPYAPTDTTQQSQVQLLQKALDRYGGLIERYREELQRRDREHAEARDRIEALREEVTDLRRRLEDPREISTDR
jgi:chromosome segregation ATPase